MWSIYHGWTDTYPYTIYSSSLPNSIDDHQYLNAKYYENKGCCLLLEQDNFNTENLFNLIMATMKNKNKLENIRENMKKNYNKNVYNDIKNEIKEFI